MKRNSSIKWTLPLLLTLSLTACGPMKLGNQQQTEGNNTLSGNVIYGSDGRLDYYQVTDAKIKALADSTVALIKTTDLTASGNTVSIRGRNYGTDMNLCATEKYREQDTAAFCSGTLVGPDTILTAGHCIETMADCSSTSFVFGFAVKAEGVLTKSVQSDAVYKCKEIVKTVRVNTAEDFAVIKLDRAVVGRKALPVRATGDVDAAASLVVIGHPVGLPTKITIGGTVRSLSPAKHFVANLDTYGGNSGSGVFNLVTGEIEGVLVRGEQDFESRGGCSVSKVCAEGACRGEDVTKISAVRPFLSTGGVVTPPPPPPVAKVEKFSSTTALAIPDNNSKGATSSLAVSSAPKGRSVSLTVNIEHSYVGDLVVKLLAPDGSSIVVHQRAGGSSKNLSKTYDVSAALSKVSVSGSYKLVVQDLASQDSGKIVSWSLEFK
ncbi:proprotein convertase P-domain-containing protein [bacterium]|nr:proprotein convertase P-domain-containing protein [bacterium]